MLVSFKNLVSVILIMALAVSGLGWVSSAAVAHDLDHTHFVQSTHGHDHDYSHDHDGDLQHEDEDGALHQYVHAIQHAQSGYFAQTLSLPILVQAHEFIPSGSVFVPESRPDLLLRPPRII